MSNSTKHVAVLICMIGTINCYSQFSKKVSVHTKCPSLSCPYLTPKLMRNIEIQATKISNVNIDRVSYQKISFDITDKSFYVVDSILSLFSRAGYPSIEIVKLEMEGNDPIDLTKQKPVTQKKN